MELKKCFDVTWKRYIQAHITTSILLLEISQFPLLTNHLEFIQQCLGEFLAGGARSIPGKCLKGRSMNASISSCDNFYPNLTYITTETYLRQYSRIRQRHYHIPETNAMPSNTVEESFSVQKMEVLSRGQLLSNSTCQDNSRPRTHFR